MRPGSCVASVGSDGKRIQSVVSTVRAIHQLSDRLCVYRSRPLGGDLNKLSIYAPEELLE